MINHVKLSLAALFLYTLTTAQAPSFQWAKQMGGTSDEQGNSIATDASGNVYTTGYFKGVADFDPGAGTYTLSSNGGVMSDVFISKLDAAGNFLWAKSMGSASADDEGKGIALDASNNVYVTGNFYGTVDFDPGAATYTMAANNTDGFILKLDVNGNFVWAKQLTGPASDNPYAIALDGSGNVYTTGFFIGPTDFDPSAATYTLTAHGGIDVYVSKLDVNGNFVWAKDLGGTDSEVGYAIASDASGNVYTTGNFAGTCDLDPGTGVNNVVSAGDDDVFISKLDVNGNFVWGKSIVGSASSHNDGGRSVKVDASGNVHIAGFVYGVADFDPSAATYNLGSNTTLNGFILKLNVSGNFVWAKELTTTDSNIPVALDLDNSGNVYAGGSYDGTSDFDPSAATYTVTAVGGNDAYILKLNALGNFIWVQDLGGGASYSNNLNGMAINTISGNIYATGDFDTTIDFDFGPGTTNLVPGGTNSFDIFVEKLGQSGFCTAPAAPTNTTLPANQSICASHTTTLAVTSTTTVSWYATPASTVALGTGTIYVTSSLPAGTYTYYAEASTCTVSATRTAITVTVNANPTIAVNSGSICSGTSFTIVPTGASTYTYSGGAAVVSPTITSTYSVTGTSSFGCVSSNTAVSTAAVNPTPAIAVNSGSVCSGASFTLNPTGASTYTYSSGTAVVTPTGTTTYSITGTSALGCIGTNTAVSTVIVNTHPVISVNSGSVCSGASFTLNATGASTYTYSSGTPVVTPTLTLPSSVVATYTVTGASVFGCTSSNTAVSSLTVYALPVINAVSNNTLLCSGQTAVLTASGATSYTWGTGANTTTISVSPTLTTTYTLSGTGNAGCSNTASITQSVSSCTSIYETVNADNSFSIYPNPNTGNFTISSNTSVNTMQIEIYDATGRLLLAKQLDNHEQPVNLNISDYSKGIYFIKMIYDGSQSYKKIIVE